MSNIAEESTGSNSTQPEANTTENVVQKPQEVNIGEEIHQTTHTPASDPVAATPSQSGNANDNEVFNADIHATDENGNPVLKDDGTFAKKRGRKPGKTKQNTQEVKAERMADFNNTAPPTTIEAVTMLFGMLCMANAKFIGPEWQPDPQEGQMMVDIWSRYIHYKGWDLDLSPEVAVIMCTVGFLAPRVMHPNFREKFFKRKKANAHPDSRNAGNGENNAGKNHSGASVSVRPGVPRG